MNVLVWSIALLGLAFGLHLAVWRIRLPARQTRALLTVFFGVLVAGLAALGAAGVMAPRWAPYLPAWPAQFLHVGLFFVSVTLAYMITYSALEADSPSLVMIQAIADAGDDGLDDRRFDQAMTDEILVAPRVRDLLRDRLASLDGERYRITAKGRRLVRIFLLHRGLLGAGKGG